MTPIAKRSNGENRFLTLVFIFSPFRLSYENCKGQNLYRLFEYRTIVVRKIRNSIIEKTLTLNFDGKQFFIRIPKRIAEVFELKKNKDYEIKIRLNPQECKQRGKKLIQIEFSEVS